MSSRVSTVRWNGSLTEGSGTIELSSSQQGHFKYALESRAAVKATATSPEELLAAAYASCYGMQLSALLTTESSESNPILLVEAEVFQGGPEVDFGITGITLSVTGRGLTISDERFVEVAETASPETTSGRAFVTAANLLPPPSLYITEGADRCLRT